jgi:carboxymethylenebutenolidase
MESISELVNIDRGTGSMNCYLARPASPGPYPALIVAMEAWGLNDQIKRIADRFAGEGFAAIVPDLYFRQTDNVADYNDLAKGFRLMGTLRDDEFVADMGAALQYLKSRREVSHNFGTVGFCLGGTVAFLTACRNPEVKAAVPFYGAGMLATTPGSGGKARSEHVSGLKAEVLGFFGELDAFIPVPEVEKLRQVLSKERKQAEIMLYPDADHGFMNEDRPSYHPIRAREAWQQTISFFKTRLR